MQQGASRRRLSARAGAARAASNRSVNSKDVTMARYQSRAHHDLARFNRLNVRFIRRHFAKTIKRDERGFYYSNADNPSCSFLFQNLARGCRGFSGRDWRHGSGKNLRVVTYTVGASPADPHGVTVAEGIGANLGAWGGKK